MIQTAPNHSEKKAPETRLDALLVAYDSSAASETALQYAVTLAQSFHSFITIAYVQPPMEVAEDLESGFGQMRESHKQLSLDLQSVAEQLTEAGISNRVLHRAGAVTDVLVQLASEFETDLLLLGAHGHRRIDRPRLGTTAEFMLRSMPCAVLTVGPGAVLPAHTQPSMRTFLYASS